MPQDNTQAEVTSVPADVTPPETPAVEAPTLTVDDLKNALQIIDVSVERKAFGGWNELLQVKAVRDRIATFIAFVSPPEEKTEEVKTEVTPAKASKKKK